MAIIENTERREKASHIVNAVCVDVEYLGIKDTQYGRKHQYKVTFEGDEENEYGEPVFFPRWYYASTHKDSAFRRDIESWVGHELTDEEMAKFKFKDMLNEQFQIDVEVVEKNGKTYNNVGTLKPPTAHVTPSGLYKRREKSCQ
jgi:hypothetical protein